MEETFRRATGPGWLSVSPARPTWRYAVSADGARWAALPEKTDERRNVELARGKAADLAGRVLCGRAERSSQGGRSNGTGIEGSSQVGKRALIRRVCAYTFGVL